MTVSESYLPFHEKSEFSKPLTQLVKRADFLRMNSTPYKHHATGFVLLARPQDQKLEISAPRIGYTASRKVGGAVQRNRAKRRLRALVAEIMAPKAAKGWDFVLIAREVTVTRSWNDLRSDLERGIARIESAAKIASNPPKIDSKTDPKIDPL